MCVSDYTWSCNIQTHIIMCILKQIRCVFLTRNGLSYNSIHIYVHVLLHTQVCVLGWKPNRCWFRKHAFFKSISVILSVLHNIFICPLTRTSKPQPTRYDRRERQIFWNNFSVRPNISFETTRRLNNRNSQILFIFTANFAIKFLHFTL